MKASAQSLVYLMLPETITLAISADILSALANVDDSWGAAILSVFATAAIAVFGYWWKKRYPSTRSVKASVAISDVRGKGNILLSSSQAAVKSWSNVTVRIRKGDFYATEGLVRAIKVEVVNISEIETPKAHEWSAPKKEWAVELKVDLGGAVGFPGRLVRSVGTNHFLVPRCDHEQSVQSVYVFWMNDGFLKFSSILITHINPHDSCADVRITDLYLKEE